MKKTNLLILLFVLLFGLLAFSANSKIDMNTTGEILFNSAYQQKNKIVLFADYNFEGNVFEIAKDITVSSDPSFDKPLELEECIVESNNIYQYTFNAPDPIDRIYIKPPVVLTPEIIKPCENVLKGQNHQLFAPDGSNWFTIDEVHLSYDSEGVNHNENYVSQKIEVLITANKTDLLPRFPSITINENNYIGTTDLSFDQDMAFTHGVFTFEYSTTKEKALTGSNLKEIPLTITEALRVHNFPTQNKEDYAVVVVTQK